MSANELVQLHAEGVRDAMRRLERERVATHPAFNSRNLPGADACEPLELALSEAACFAQTFDPSADVATDAHVGSMTSGGAGVDGERWFILGGDFDAAEYSRLTHDDVEF